MVKFKTVSPYYDREMATYHMDVITGDYVLFHENGEYWTYKKYTKKQIPDLIGDPSYVVKWASKNSSSRSEL